MKKRILKIVGFSLLGLVLLVGITVGWLYIYSQNYKIPEQAASIENDTGLIQAFGRTLYDANGQPIQLKGVNVGQLLMQEGYWYYVDVFYRFPTFILGILLGFYVTEERKLGKKDIAFWGLWLALGFLYLSQSLAQRTGEGFRLQLPLCHLFLFTTVPMCLALCAAFEKLPLGWLQKPLRKIGECSLEIYLWNASIFTQVELLRKFVRFGPSNRLYYLIMFTVNIALGIGFHHLMERLAPKKRLQTTKFT